MNRDDLAIHQLHIRADSRDEARRAAELLRQYSASPLDDAWILIRRLELAVTGEALARETQAAATRLARTAVDGWSALAPSAEVVRFANRAEAMAALILDLSRDCADQRWYWRRWLRQYQPASIALTEVLVRHIDIAPAIVAVLAGRDQLTEVWRRLDGAAVAALAAALNRHYQLEGSFSLRLQLLDGATLALAETLASQPHWPQLLRRWRQPWQVCDRDSGARHLAMALIALEHFPALLKQRGAAVVTALAFAFQQRLADATPQGESQGASKLRNKAVKARGEDAASSLCSSSPVVPGEDQTATPTLATLEPEERAPVDAGGDASQDNAILKPRVDERIRDSGSVPDQAGKSAFSEDVALATESVDKAAPLFHSHYGGLFYLVNALNQAAVQALLRRSPFWTEPGAPWRLLYRLGCQLGLASDDPLVPFLAGQMGFAEAGPLIALPPLPEERMLLQMLKTRYQRHGLWAAELIAVPANIAATASHIDAYLAMSAVTLPLRLSGLDINPGWVSWLGRVVAFHYRHEAVQ